MALNDPVPGLRSMVNPSHDVAKVSLVVPAGETVDASEYVAEQLERQGFKDAGRTADRITVNVQALPDVSGAAVVEAVKAVKGRKA
jgi:hypothetical protein